MLLFILFVFQNIFLSKAILYNLAYTPSQEFVKEGLTIYSKQYSELMTHENYALGEGSIPHITLCQFDDENNDFETVYKELKILVNNNYFDKFLEIEFNRQRCQTYDKKYSWSDKCLISLIPSELNNIKLLKNHIKSNDIINKCAGKIMDNYDPHLTLYNSKK